MFLKDKIDVSKPVLIAGPTASGKSALALELAARHNGLIINADALQVYECWRVLTARPSAKDEARAPHMLYGHVPCDHVYSVGAWLRDVKPLLDMSSGRLPIVVGGTGLYLSSLTNGLAEIPQISDEVRDRAEQILAADGFHELLAQLQSRDPATVARIDTQNPVRVQRAWEVWQSTGRGLADWQDHTPNPVLPLSECNAFVVNTPKELLTPRINYRFRSMLDQGALDECRAMLPNWDPTRPSSRAIGASELIDHLQGKTDLETAIAAAEIATRQYAKRQRSWFRARMKDWEVIDGASR